jgi:hypothetical protein
MASAQHFDIVNGFFNRCRDGAILVGFGRHRSGHRINKAEKEIIRIIAMQTEAPRSIRMVVGGADSQA